MTDLHGGHDLEGGTGGEGRVLARQIDAERQS
jgi:hypothetical protein